MISFKKALHFKQLLILITAARAYLGLKGAFPFTVIGHLIRKGRKQSRTQRQSIRGGGDWGICSSPFERRFCK